MADPERSVLELDSDRQRSGETVCELVAEHDEVDDEMRDRADLIAAAPELLAALKMVSKGLRLHAAGYYVLYGLGDGLEKISEAIAKATGMTPWPAQDTPTTTNSGT